MKLRPVVLALVLIVGAVIVPTRSVLAVAVDRVVTVDAVVDGDTFEYFEGDSVVRVRVAGLNANELALTPKCWVDEATARLAGLIEGRQVRLLADSSSSSAGGRPYRHVLLDGVDVATILVREGLAVPLVLRQEPRFHDRLLTAARLAAAEGIGVWDDEGCGRGPTANIEMITNGDGDGDDHADPNVEYVRLRNRGSSTVELAGWTLTDSSLESYRFPGSASIAPGGLVTVFVGRGSDTATRFYMNRSAPIFSDEFDGAYLLDPLNNIREYDFWPCFGPCEGQPPALVIDAVSYDPPGNDDLDPNGEWVRVKNASGSAVNFQDWEVASAPHRLRPERSIWLQSGESLTVYVGRGADGPGKLYLGRTRSIFDTSGDVVTLTGPGGDVADCFAYGIGSCAPFEPKKPVRLPDLPPGRRVPAGGERCFAVTWAEPGEFVALNVTPLDAVVPGFGIIYSSDDAAGQTSSVNFGFGSVDPNVSFVRVGDDGKVCFANSNHGSVHVVIDGMAVGGPTAFRSPSSSGAVRLADTRRGLGGGLLAPSERRCFAAAGRSSEFTALNVTPVAASGPGYGTVHSSDTDAGSTSSVNFSPGSVDPNLAVVQIGRDGRVCFTNSEHGSVHVVLDQMVIAASGTFEQSSSSGAVRLADTRSGLGGGRLTAGETRCLDVVGAAAGDWVGLNVTPVDAATAGFGVVHSSDDPPGRSSSVNFGHGTVDPNFAFSEVGRDRQVCFTNSEHGPVDVVVDQLVVADGHVFRPPTSEGSTRLADTRRK